MFFWWNQENKGNEVKMKKKKNIVKWMTRENEIRRNRKEMSAVFSIL